MLSHCLQNSTDSSEYSPVYGALQNVFDVLQIVTKAAQRLSLQSHPRHPMDCYVPAQLQSIAMPLELVLEDTATPASANQSDILPPLTEYTPRMVQVSIKDTDMQQGQCNSTSAFLL